MKFLVCISLVPDTTTKISFVDNDTKFNNDKVQWILNPYDEWYALVRALELKEANGGSVTVVNVGPAENEQVIRRALAIGADDAIRIDLSGDADSYAIASEIAAVAKSGGYDMVLLGKETINYNGASVGAMVAGIMDLPHISMATKMEVSGAKITAEHDVDGGSRVVECELPVVVSCAKGMAEQRIPNMRGIMAARTKPLAVVPAGGGSALTTVKSYSLNPGRTTCKMIGEDNMDELVQLLHTEAKVI